jgi:Zn-dependent protease with chaperone function
MKIDNYLEIIQEDEEKLQEFDPITIGAIGAGIATFIILKELVFFFIFVAQLASQIKVDPNLSKKLNDILKPLGVKKDFKVHILPQKVPNAFTPGGKHVYMTSGLLKLLNEREVLAVLLHEVYHAIDLHVIKRMAAEFPLYYIAAPLAVAAAGGALALGPFAFILGLIVFSISLSVLSLPLKLIMGRKHEYSADNYAVKAGYGKEIAGALQKLEDMITKMSAGRSCGAVCKVINKIEEKMDEHPPTRKRIEVALKNTELLKAIMKGKISNIVYKVKAFFSKGD